MTDRERLTALLMAGAGDCLGKGGALNCSRLADYLLEHGVIVLPCKVGKYEKGRREKMKYYWFTFADGYSVCAKGFSKQELRVEENKHGKLLRKVEA